MKYCKITIHTTTEGSEAFSEALMDAGASGAMIEDAADLVTLERDFKLFDGIEQRVIDSMPEDVCVTGYLPLDSTLADRLAALRQRVAAILALSGEDIDFGSGAIDVSDVDEADWANEWKKYFKPLKVGKRFVVKPTWEPYEKKDGELVIELDPGMAFGTGTHETTRLCMQRLEHFERLIRGGNVLDVGCGSGILSLTAAMLGAKTTAIDLDPVCVEAASANVLRNGLSGMIGVKLGNLLDGDYGENDCIVANIITDVIIALAPAAHKALRPGGVFISSGIIRERAREVRAALSAAGFIGKETFEEGEWVAISCFKNEF